MDDMDKIINQLSMMRPKHPIPAEIHFYSLDYRRVIEKLQKHCSPAITALGPHAGPIVSSLTLREDDKVIPGFAQVYDGRGKMIKTINLERAGL